MTITLNRACDAVRFRDTAKGQLQRDVLRQFEKDSERKRSAIVALLDAEIDVGHDQYRRYLRGDTPLRWDQIDVFARAFGITQSELSRALGLMDDEMDPALCARAADALGPNLAPQMQEQIREMARELSKYDASMQDDVLGQVKDVLARRAAESKRS